jgi:hypothetical protein
VKTTMISFICRYLSFLATLACLLILFDFIEASICWAEPPWDTMPYTSFQDMQAVNEGGSSAWTVPVWGTGSEQGFKLKGVVLNNPQDMLDFTPNYIACAAGTQWKLGGQWQIYIQTVDSADFGGAALWMAQNYGNVTWHWPDSSYSYTNLQWEAETARVSLNNTIQAGDVVEIDARGGLFHNGKFNVNEQHDNDPAFDFDVKLISHGSLPDPALITIEDVKNSDGTFKFVQDRLSGAEHYQSTLVRLNDVSLVDPADWKSNSTVTITDGTLTLPMLLGANGFDPLSAPTGKFNVVGIFDQDGSDYRGGYQLWVTDAGQFAGVPEPSGIVLLIFAAFCFGVLKQSKRLIQSK